MRFMDNQHIAGEQQKSWIWESIAGSGGLSISLEASSEGKVTGYTGEKCCLLFTPLMQSLQEGAR